MEWEGFPPEIQARSMNVVGLRDSDKYIEEFQRIPEFGRIASRGLEEVGTCLDCKDF